MSRTGVGEVTSQAIRVREERIQNNFLAALPNYLASLPSTNSTSSPPAVSDHGSPQASSPSKNQENEDIEIKPSHPPSSLSSPLATPKSEGVDLPPPTEIPATESLDTPYDQPPSQSLSPPTAAKNGGLETPYRHSPSPPSSPLVTPRNEDFETPHHGSQPHTTLSDVSAKSIREREEKVRNNFLAAMPNFMASIQSPSQPLTLLETPENDVRVEIETSARESSIATLTQTMVEDRPETPDPNGGTIGIGIGLEDPTGEGSQTIPQHSTSDVASSNVVFPPQAHSPPRFKRSDPTLLKQLALNQLRDRRSEEGELKEENKEQSMTSGKSAISVDDILSRLARHATGSHDPNLAKQYSTNKPDTDDGQIPPGLRRLGYGIKPGVITGVPSFMDIVKFPEEFLRANWNFDVANPAIVHPRKDSLPEILVLYSADQAWTPEAPQVHGAMLHVSLASTHWPVLDDMHVFVVNKAGTESGYFGKYCTPRDCNWDNEPILPDMLNREAITRLPEHVKQSFLTNLYNYGVAGNTCSLDYIKALAARFFPELYNSEARDMKPNQKKDEVMAKLKGLDKHDIVEAFEKDHGDMPLGLRFLWVTLQAAGWDQQFYEKLIALRNAGV